MHNGTPYLLIDPYVVWQRIVIVDNIYLNVLTDLKVFSIPEYEKAVLECHLSVCMYVYMYECMYVRLTGTWTDGRILLLCGI
jgi:hypothetical protein